MFMDNDDDDDDDDDGNDDDNDDNHHHHHHHHKCFPIKNHNKNAGILNIYCTMFCTTIVLGMQHGFGQWKHISVRH